MKTKQQNSKPLTKYVKGKSIMHILLPLLFLFAIAAASSCGGGGGGGGGAPAGGGGGGTTPDITVTDSTAPINDLQVQFGYVTLNNPSDQTVTITNDGTADLTIGTIASANPLLPPFVIATNNCPSQPQTLAPGANCKLTVRFTPTVATLYTDSFDIPSDDPDENPVTVTVSGTGTAALVPDITVTDSAGDPTDLLIGFGTIGGGSIATATVTVKNDGTANLTIGSIGQADALVAPFSIIQPNNCPGQGVSVILLPGGSCTLTVQFFPTATGYFTDTFDIPSDDPDENPVTVSVTGTGDLTPPTVTSTTPVDGGGMTVGSNIIARFSEPMNSSTLTISTFTLVDEFSTAAAGVVSYNTTNNSATFNPTNNLAPCTGYTATITTGATDLVGNGLATDYIWSFTTMNVPPTTPCP